MTKLAVIRTKSGAMKSAMSLEVVLSRMINITCSNNLSKTKTLANRSRITTTTMGVMTGKSTVKVSKTSRREMLQAVMAKVKMMRVSQCT